MNIITAFATALVEHLKGSVPKNTHSEGGCDTCGYGGYEVEDGIDEAALYREIDAFAATFQVSEAHRQHKADREGA